MSGGAAQPRASVVMVVHDGAATTRTCLESLRATDEPFALVVVDNGSTDDTPRLFRDLASPWPLRYARNESNASVLAAYNQAWRLAATEFVCLLHNDTTMLEPAWLARLLAPLATPDVGLSGLYGVKRVRRDGRYAGRTIVHSLAEGPTVRAPWEEVAVVDGVCLCLRRATLEAVGGIDEGYGFFHGYDRDLSFAVRETGRRCVVVHAPFRHAGGGTRTREFAARPELEHRDLADRRAATERFARKFAHRLPSDVRPVTARVADWLGRRASPQGVRRWLVLALALALGGCAGIDSSAPAPGPGPAPGRRGEGHRGMREARAASSVARDTDPVATWETVQTRVRRGEAAAVLADTQRLAAAATTAGDAGSALIAHTAAAYAALRLSRLDTVLREAEAAVAAGDKARDWPFTGTFVARARRFAGLALAQIGRPGDAERELLAALAVAQVASLGQPHIGTVSSINGSLALLAARRGDHDAAVRYAEDAVRMTESGMRDGASARHPQRRMRLQRQLASAQVDLATIYFGAGRVDDAGRAAADAFANARAVGAPDFQVKARALLAHVAARRHDPRTVALYEEAIAGARRTNQVWLLTSLHAGLAQFQATQGHTPQALDSARQAIELTESVRGQLQEAEMRSSFFEGKQELYQIRLALSLNQLAEGFAFAERSRARAFLDLLGTHTALSKGRTEALAAEELRLRARLAAARAGAEPDDEGERGGDAGVAAAERDYAEFLKTVRAASGEQASLMSVEPVTLAEVQALLDEGTTLLEYLVTRGEVVVWVVDRTHAEVVRVRVRRDARVTEVRDFRRAIADRAPAAEVERRAAALHQRLVAPLRAHVRGERVVIVPHDVLHYLPFAALRSPEGRWLVEDWRLSTVPSASVLKYLPSKGTAASGPAVALGNPELGPELALRFAEREVRAVADALPGARVYVRGQAPEHEAKALGPTASVGRALGVRDGPGPALAWRRAGRAAARVPRRRHSRRRHDALEGGRSRLLRPDAPVLRRARLERAGGGIAPGAAREPRRGAAPVLLGRVRARGRPALSIRAAR